ncbi:MAG: GGDEF domain-containing protein [Candidatus Cloacimonadales bacterium]|jgi:diguanylate cyclase (GGDEF)-like protein|nr:GGDEF domain-containing protein [Candidatus Cloacimonadota bacterium]MCB5257416.1 GGDEF domain-containing protein [Candidatus Cloacimonadota bacterium]MCB5264154.1 GGDEF domain-containing protein [Candidatus Cloacimonadota bacterium]MCB5276325.1 GGDEF domain-containing protein [Candidatus Cloacimonadota bacterium]MDD2615770.1 GGDEF domain-containing protein [Candidatus Cloacimonadota bacterium]
MKLPYDIPAMSEISPKAVAEIQRLATELFDIHNRTLDKNIEHIVNLTVQHISMIEDPQRFVAVIAVFFDACFSCLSKPGKGHDSELYKFFVIMNHLPVLDNSPFYAQTLDILSQYFRKDSSVIKLFDKLQLLYLLVEIKHFDAAAALATELEHEITEEHLSFYTMYQICRFKIMDAFSNVEAKINILLQLTTHIFHTEGEECALFLIGRWISSLDILRPTPYYRALASNLYAIVKKHKNINSAIVGYELFSMEDRLISPDLKMSLFSDLMSLKENMLNAEQLHALHFFAGNYVSGRNENFRDSIQSFKSSNYFLHKCWERLIGISKYLRMHGGSCDYKVCIGYLDKLYLDLSHQTSMRNNSYVENLQANYDRIEELYTEVGELSLRDTLTGLRNRRYMENNLLQIVALAFRHKASVSFAMMDIDFFKRVNDTYGHAAGDMILRELGKMLASAFRKSDIIIRYGGEEFLVVLFDIMPDKCLKMMEDLRREIEIRTFKYQRHKIKITISIGLACNVLYSASEYGDLLQSIKNADKALYVAKESGRNRVEMYQPEKNPA